jgi:hypothetical protein
MITRQAYLDSTTGDRAQDHRAYYAQFVTDHHRATVARFIGLTKLVESKDPHFNDIPLRKWDAIEGLILTPSTSAHLRKAGDFPTSGGSVCIAKEAARQLLEAV